MRINSVSNQQVHSQNNVLKSSLSFGDALSTKQAEEYKQLIRDIREDQGYQDGINIVKIYSPALPSRPSQDTGIGKITSNEAREFYKYASTYFGATAIKFMPMGQLTDKQVYSDKHYPGPYNRSSFAIGEDVINIADLATAKWGNILSKHDVDKVVSRHRAYKTKTGSASKLIDFETTLGWKNQEDYPINETLRTAFDNFKSNKNPSAELRALRSEFEAFKNQKEPVDYDDIYTRLALFPYLKDWATAKTDFFEGFDSDPEIRAQKMPEYNRLKEEHKDVIEFYKFKQFLAHKTIQEGVDMVHAEGMDAIGDCAYGFSWPEQQVFPDAFIVDEYGRSARDGLWGLPVINYWDLIQKDNSPAHQLLRAKISHYLNYYDGIRFDVGWAYMNSSYHFGDYNFTHVDTGTAVTDFIERVAKDVKGQDFDQRKLMYECDADFRDFDLQGNIDRIKKVKGLAILSTEHEKNDEANIGWGNAAFLKENLGFSNDDIMLGTNTHDGKNVLECASDPQKFNEHLGALMRIFKLRREDGVIDGWHLLKGTSNTPDHYEKYTRGRFAELATVKNSFILYTDLLGRSERVDYHTDGTGPNGQKDYRNRLEKKWEENAHRALQGGVGYNAADVQRFRMAHDGTMERRPDLYERAAKYAAYLKHQGGIYTREAADNSPRANLNIDSMSFEEINNLDRVG